VKKVKKKEMQKENEKIFYIIKKCGEKKNFNGE
jgi:hypothetical protein